MQYRFTVAKFKDIDKGEKKQFSFKSNHSGHTLPRPYLHLHRSTYSSLKQQVIGFNLQEYLLLCYFVP